MGPERHPSALGQRGRECWAEIWDVSSPNRAGDGWRTARRGMRTTCSVTRHGRLEQAYWTLRLQPDWTKTMALAVLVLCRMSPKIILRLSRCGKGSELARVQQSADRGPRVDLRTGFHNRRSPEYLQINGCRGCDQRAPRGLGPAFHPEDREAAEKKFRKPSQERPRIQRAVRLFARATVRRGGFRSNPRSSVTSREEPSAWSAHTRCTRAGRGEQALRQSEERFRKLRTIASWNATLAQRVEEKTRERDRSGGVAGPFTVADRTGVWRSINPAWTRTLGWSEADCSTDLGGLVHPEMNPERERSSRSSLPTNNREVENRCGTRMDRFVAV